MSAMLWCMESLDRDNEYVDEVINGAQVICLMLELTVKVI